MIVIRRFVGIVLWRSEMSIVIYTYSDPYKINTQPYWEEIKHCPYFCASQTLANGLRSVYKELVKGRITTIQKLVEGLYPQWESSACLIKQTASIDNILRSETIPESDKDFYNNIRNSFLFNHEEVLKSIRILFELNTISENIIEERLTEEQRYIVNIYNRIKCSKDKNIFNISENFSKDTIDNAINNVMAVDDNIDISDTEYEKIVIHGVHQFTPIMLRAIDEISKYKKVILLFNYQKQYKDIYQTWIDIYSSFDCKINVFNGEEFTPSIKYPISYEGNMLADKLGKLSSGNARNVYGDKLYEITEFDNMTEFANYVAGLFERATNLKNGDKNPLAMMSEQIYAADTSANDILKIYYPKQFGERQFLNYPLGHFFLAVANMWDSQSNKIVVSDINDIKECFESGILNEDYVGQLSGIWNKAESLFDRSNTIDDMIFRIKTVRKSLKRANSDTRDKLEHISYYSISDYDLSKLANSLKELENLASYFYEDFNIQEHNFKIFYQRLRLYIQDNVLNDRHLDDDFEDIVRRVLDRLEEVEDIEASASFDCLKSTMTTYLEQEKKPGSSANWIIRGFEQIDGDILRTNINNSKNRNVIYHFACLSDEDVNSVNTSAFPWPLDENFFEVAQEPVDWKNQVFVASRKEYKNYKRYALIYGLEFNRARFKLSYVKHDGEKEKDPYYLLKILGIDKIAYTESKVGKRLPYIDLMTLENNSRSFDELDYYKYRICKYKFLLESIIEGTTIYKDSFLLTKYLEVILENEVFKQQEGFPVSEKDLIETLNDIYDDFKKYFPFLIAINRIDIINTVKSRIIGSKIKIFPKLSDEKIKQMKIRELFLHDKLENRKKFNKNILNGKFSSETKENIENILSDENIEKLTFLKEADLWCKFCPNKDLCVEFFKMTDV